MNRVRAVTPTVELPIDAAKRGQRARRRGARGETQVVEILRAFGWPKARRHLGRDIYQSQAGRDIIDGPAGTWISVKLTERLRLREAFAECANGAGDTNVPIVAHRCNGQPWLATIELTELLSLLQLRERG